MDILDQILNAQKGSRDEKVENFKSLFAEIKQDKDIEDKKGTQPAKYFKGMSKSTKDKRDAHFNKNKSGPAPGDATAKTKPSKFNSKFKKMYGEELEENAGLEKKAEKSGMPLSILKKVYNRGLAAYKGGHRPGATAPQWAMARVNSFVTKSKGTWGKADADLAKKVRGESLSEEDNVAVKAALAKAKQVEEMERLKAKHEQELEALKTRHERENERLKGAKEQEVERDAIDKKRDALRKANEELEEGKLVADTMDIVSTVMKKIEKQVQKEIKKNKEKGLGMLNTLGSFVGAKVTDKKQEKGRLFLKFGDNLDEAVDVKKVLKKVKGLTKQQIQVLQTLPTPVLTSMINQLSLVMGEERDYKKEYENYHSSPEQIKRRAKRNEARRILKNRKGIKGKDVHHKDNNPMNNDKSNLSIVSQNYNRKEPRLREKGEK